MCLVDVLADILGTGDSTFELNAGQYLLRGVIVYIFAIAVLRLGDKRFLGKSTAFDVILGIMLGSVMSRAITGGSPFFATLLVSAMLVGLHWAFAYATYHTDSVGDWVKGVPRHLIKDGKPQQATLQGSHISDNDLVQALRTSQGTTDISRVDQAFLERAGEISFLMKPRDPKVVEINVRDGVQTVRIQWEE